MERCQPIKRFKDKKKKNLQVSLQTADWIEVVMGVRAGLRSVAVKVSPLHRIRDNSAHGRDYPESSYSFLSYGRKMETY